MPPTEEDVSVGDTERLLCGNGFSDSSGPDNAWHEMVARMPWWTAICISRIETHGVLPDAPELQERRGPLLPPLFRMQLNGYGGRGIAEIHLLIPFTSSFKIFPHPGSK